jgi:hypothetical protein
VIDGADLRVRDRETVRVDAAGIRAGRAEAAHTQDPPSAPFGILVTENALQVVVRAAEIAVLDDDGTGLAAWRGPCRARVGKRGLFSEVGDDVAVEACEQCVGRNPEAFSDALHLDIAVGVVVAHEGMLRVEPGNDVGQSERRAELAQPSRHGNGHVRNPVGTKLRLHAAAVVRGAAKVEDPTGGSRHGPRTRPIRYAAALASSRGVSGRAPRNPARSSASLALAILTCRSLTWP